MKILVSGVVNMETSLRIDEFPINYNSINFVNDRVSSNLGGVGYNIVKALSVLGRKTRFFTLTARDFVSEIIDHRMIQDGVELEKLEILSGTPQSVVIYNRHGDRQINTDLKDIHLKSEVEESVILKITEGIEFGVLTNMIYSKALIPHFVKNKIPFATDLQAIDHYSNEYNRLFMENAEILFLSNDNLKCSEEEFINYIFDNYKAEIVCVGQGKKGLIIGEKGKGITKYSAPGVKVVNSIGAGDALFSSFIHFYLKNRDAQEAIKKALIFVGEKLKTANSSLGFIAENEVERILGEL